MLHSESLQNIFEALSNVQGEIQDAEKDVKAHNYKYANLSQVLCIIRPLSSKNGLAITQHATVRDGMVIVETRVGHKSGEWMSSELSMPLIESKNMNSCQSVGNVITYARRYALTSIFGITQQDEDAQGDDIHRNNNQYRAPMQAATSPVMPDAVSFGLEYIKQAFQDDDKLGALDHYRSLNELNKRGVYNYLPTDEKVWLKNLLDMQPKVK